MPDTPVASSQIILVALTDLRDPDWNPRPFLDETEMVSLVEYIAAGRPVPPIEILKNPGQAGPWDVISGKRRCEAHRRAGKTHIEAIVRDVPLEEAKFMAIAANRDDKPFWLGEFIAVYNLKKNVYGEQKLFAQKLGWTEKRVSKAFNLIPLLNPASRDLIYQSTRPRITPGNSSEGQTEQDTPDGPTWRLTEKVAVRLIPLWDDKAQTVSQYRAEQAIQQIIKGQLTASQTDDLVAHTLTGNDPAQFEPTTKVRKARKPVPTAHPPLPTEMTDKVVELGPTTTSHSTTSHPAHTAPAASIPTTDPNGWFWEMLVGIKFINQLRSRAKKGELTLTDRVLILLYWVFLKPFVFLFGHLGKLLKEAGKGIWRSIKEATGKTFTRILEWAFPLILICALIWGAGKVYQWVIVTPLHWLGSEIKSGFHWGGTTPAEVPTPVPTPVSSLPSVPVASASRFAIPPQTSISKGLGQPKHVSRPVASTQVYQPAVSFVPSASPSKTLFDPKILEIEIAAIPKNSIVKDYPFTPDETMPGDLAVSRLQDLTDTDRYTMKMGSSTEKILSITPTTTNLILNYKSADALGGFLDGSGQLNFFWEDVKYVHINEIDVETKTPSVIYQCSLIVSGSKNPLTIQCASTEDLEHLVSTLEYFIRSSRLAHDAQPAGLPYLNQGLVFNNLCVVEKLWANSPAALAGITLTDHLWSVAKATGDPQEKKDFEKGLGSAQVPVTLFVTSDPDWNKALIAKNSGMTNVFRPKLKKVVLTAT